MLHSFIQQGNSMVLFAYIIYMQARITIIDPIFSPICKGLEFRKCSFYSESELKKYKAWQDAEANFLVMVYPPFGNVQKFSSFRIQHLYSDILFILTLAF